MMKAVPVVSVNIVMNTKPYPGSYTIGEEPSAGERHSVTAMPKDWTKLRTTVKYRVY
jgi:hypothetical protein